MNQTARYLLFIAMAGTMFAAAQTPDGAAQSGKSVTDNPVAQVREAKSIEYGPFAYYGNGIGDRSNYRFFAFGGQAGKPLTRVLHAGILSGQFEYGFNIMPFWQAYTPAPHQQASYCEVNGQIVACELSFGGGTFTGLSLTPVILRWNFLTRSRRFQPWFQGAGGLIYTTHKFPPEFLTTQTINGETVNIDSGTSVWNFSPQGGIGFHYFTRARRSIDVGINAVHISSASLGDRNPGVNASVQFQVGYTFWK